MGFYGQISPAGQALQRVSGFPQEENICYSTSQPVAVAGQGEVKKYSHPQVLLRCLQQTGLFVCLSPASPRQPPQTHRGGGDGKAKRHLDGSSSPLGPGYRGLDAVGATSPASGPTRVPSPGPLPAGFSGEARACASHGRGAGEPRGGGRSTLCIQHGEEVGKKKRGK